MLSVERRAVRGRARGSLGRLVSLSLALHLALLAALLWVSPPQPQTSDAGALSLDVVAEAGPAAAEPAEASAAPGAPEPPVEPAAAPPVADVSPAPPVQPAETPTPDLPPPPQAQQAETMPPPPDAPPPPVQQAEVPPPPPPPPPAPPQPRPIAQAHPQRPPPRTAARPATARASADPAGAPDHATGRATEGHAADGQDAASRGGAANAGAAWMGKLRQWWDEHSFYPQEASQTNEGGNVRVHIAIAPDGQVTAIDVVQGSGSGVLDAAAVAVFRNAHLPPFPPGTQVPPADVVVTLHYRPAGGGG